MDSISDLPKLSERVPVLRRPDLPQDLGLTWRALTVEDAAQLSALIRTIEEHDDSPFRTSEQETESLLTADHIGIADNSVVAVSERGSFLAYGLLRRDTEDDAAASIFLDGGVHPSVRSVGLGHAIVDWLTVRAHELLVELDVDLPGRILAHLQDNAEDSWQPYEDNGFGISRYFKGLRRDASAKIDPVELAPTLRLVPYSQDLTLAIRSAHDDAFGDHWSSDSLDPVEWEQTINSIEPSWSFAVLDEEASELAGELVVAGYILVSKNEQEWEIDGYSSGYVEMLGVRKSNRGQRIAIALLTAVTTAIRESGVQFVELDVDSEAPDGGVGMYTYLGFTVARSSRLYSLEF